MTYVLVFMLGIAAAALVLLCRASIRRDINRQIEQHGQALSPLERRRIRR